MKTSWPAIRSIVFGLARGVLALTLASVVLFMAGVWESFVFPEAPWNPIRLYAPLISLASCASEPEGKYAISSDLVVSVVYTSCKVLASEEFVSVAVSNVSGKYREEIFNFDPGETELVPVVSMRGNSIFVSISEVSSIIYQAKSYGKHPIIDNIGKIYYPSPASLPPPDKQR